MTIWGRRAGSPHVCFGGQSSHRTVLYRESANDPKRTLVICLISVHTTDCAMVFVFRDLTCPPHNEPKKSLGTVSPRPRLLLATSPPHESLSQMLRSH